MRSLSEIVSQEILSEQSDAGTPASDSLCFVIPVPHSNTIKIHRRSQRGAWGPRPPKECGKKLYNRSSCATGQI